MSLFADVIFPIVFAVAVIVLAYFFIVSAVKRGVKEGLAEAREDAEVSRSDRLWGEVQTRTRQSDPSESFSTAGLSAAV